MQQLTEQLRDDIDRLSPEINVSSLRILITSSSVLTARVCLLSFNVLLVHVVVLGNYWTYTVHQKQLLLNTVCNNDNTDIVCDGAVSVLYTASQLETYVTCLSKLIRFTVTEPLCTACIITILTTFSNDIWKCLCWSWRQASKEFHSKEPATVKACSANVHYVPEKSSRYLFGQ